MKKLPIHQFAPGDSVMIMAGPINMTTGNVESFDLFSGTIESQRGHFFRTSYEDDIPKRVYFPQYVVKLDCGFTSKVTECALRPYQLSLF